MTTEAPDLASEPPDQPPPELALVLPRRSPIDWERTHFTPAFVRALAKAQLEAATVGKSSTIEGRGSGDNAVKARKYAGADAMIDEATRVFASNGIAWVCASTSHQPTERRHIDENGEKQWVCSIVETTSILAHASIAADPEGHTADEVGMLVTFGETASIGRNGTPIDKADKAAETYLRLYLARDLAGLDRGDADDDPNKRDDAESGAGRRGSARASDSKVDPRRQAARDLVVARWKILAELLRMRDGVAPNSDEWSMRALGGELPTTLDDFALLAKHMSEEIALIKDDARAP